MACKRKIYSTRDVIEPEDDDALIENPNESRWSCVRQRAVVAAATFFGFAIAYSTRINLSVAMVAMVNESYIADKGDHDNVTRYDVCPNLTSVNASDKNYVEGEFKWDQYTQGIILSSFFYGYVVSQIPGGILADKYGAKHVIGIGVLLSSVFSLMCPWAAKANLYLFISLRVVEGMLQGVIYPASSSLMAAWAPVNERVLMNMAPTLGVYFGIIIAFPLSGVLCQYGFGGGWPSAFYVFGIAGIVWYLPWLYLTANSPDTHRRISDRELAYIQLTQSTVNRVKMPVPWRSILTSLRVWAIFIALGGGAFGYGALLAFLPTYMKQVLKFDLISGGVVSVAPYISSLVATLVGGYMGDMISLRLHSVTAARKIMTVFSNVVAGVLMLMIPFAGCSRYAVIGLLTVSGFFGSLNIAGTMVNPIDLAPQYSGSIMGFCNVAGTLGMMLGPYVTGMLTNHAQTLEAWARAFYSMGGVSIVSGLIYLLLASGNLQPWAIAGKTVTVLSEESDTDSSTDVVVNRASHMNS